MSQAPTPTPLDYYRPKLVKQPQTPESIRWRWYRVGYRAGLAVLFLSVAFYFGPNEIRFDKLTWLTPADFVPIVQHDCLATVRAIKQYQRDTGHLPNRMEDLTPMYLPKGVIDSDISNGSYEYISWRWNEQITYDFTPASEGWYVSGPYVSGRIPLPTVKPGPAAKQSAPMITGDMYCKKCYAKLEPADGFNRCQQCGRAFNPANDLSYLRRPFPGKLRIVIQVVGTTAVGFAVAYVVATFQMAGGSGH